VTVPGSAESRGPAGAIAPAGAAAPAPHTFQPDIYDRILPLLPRDTRSRILDVGAGQGYLSRRLKDLGYDVEACDFRADDFRCPDIPFLKADLNAAIPAGDDTYDCVVSVEVIEHIENHFRFIRELVRVTRPGGLIVITTPNTLSLTSRLHYFLYGYTDCAPLPLDPGLEHYYLQHINPISLPEILFALERFGADLVGLETNRFRRSSWAPFVILYPLLTVALRLKLLKKKHAAQRALHRRHARWMLHPANLLGRITIAVARRRAPAR
jgi:2-polyprenyl-3-methyl-5-hydroxy-6-metoxy-1,4-benzoquinol methylase